MEVLLIDQKSDEGKNKDTLAALKVLSSQLDLAESRLIP
jgi:hypothetical protein